MTLKRHLTPAKLKNRLGILALFVLDLAVLFGFFHLAMLLRHSVLPLVFKRLPEYSYDFGHHWWIFAVWLFIMLYEGGYSRRFALWDEVKFLWKSTFFSSVAVLSMLFLMKRGQEYSRILVVTMFALSTLFFPLLRLRVKRLLYSAGLLRRKILIVGSGKAALSAYSAIINEPNLGYELAGFIDNAPSPDMIASHKVHRGIEDVEQYIKSADIHDVIVAKPELPGADLAKLINAIQHKAENTLFIPDISGIAVSGTQLRHFFKEQTIILEISNNLSQPLTYFTKRIMDYAASSVMFLFLAVPMMAIALAIRLTTHSDALFKQKRFGKNGRKFLCYKFQTMYPDAEQRLKTILDNDPEAREEFRKYWKLKNDPRVTPIGQFLRSTSLDELPQFLNVIKGEMSLVGPRPLPPDVMAKYPKEEESFYYMVPPGITGLWQVSGRSNTSFEYHASLNSWYVKNWSLWLDVMILFKTVGVVLGREGAV